MVTVVSTFVVTLFYCTIIIDEDVSTIATDTLKTFMISIPKLKAIIIQENLPLTFWSISTKR